jgi:1-acyl-sn-glycerol-3-phosphate acyltransferase
LLSFWSDARYGTGVKAAEASFEPAVRRAPPFRPITIPRRFHPGEWGSREDRKRAWAALVRVGKKKARPNDLDARDEAFIRDIWPVMDVLYDRYFRCETELAAELPKGPYLAVANHNGMTGTPDMFCHMVAFWRHEGPTRVAYGLMHDMPFNVPAAGAWLNAAGAIAASQANARAALQKGAAVLVFPGGDVDACKPFHERYEIRFAGRRGFIRLALREGVPIVPVVSVGGHESLYILDDGSRIARTFGLQKSFRSNVFPIGAALPWGVIFGIPYPHFPLPVKVHTRFGAPIHFREPPSAADDPEIVEACFQRVATEMDGSMTELRAAKRHGLFPSGLLSRMPLARGIASSVGLA